MSFAIPPERRASYVPGRVTVTYPPSCGRPIRVFGKGEVYRMRCSMMGTIILSLDPFKGDHVVTHTPRAHHSQCGHPG